MAYKRYQRKRRKPFELPKAAVPKQPTTYDPARQVEGLEKRLEGSGIDVEKATDKRNFIEKALNLTPDQNFFFDVFEVLGRPQQAIFNGVKALQEGGSFGEGFAKGLSGDDYTNFGEILNEAGFGEKETFGADDVVGFIGDVFLDPIDLAIMAGSVAAAAPTGGLSIPVGTGLVTAFNAASDTAKTVNAINNISDFVKVSKTASKANIFKKIGEGFKATGKLYKDIGIDVAKGRFGKAGKKLFTSKNIKLIDGTVITKTSITDLTMKPFKAAFKYGGKGVGYVAKTGIIRGISAFKGKDIKTATDIVNTALKSIESFLNQGARLGGRLLTEAQIGINKLSGNKLYSQAYINKVTGMMDDLTDKVFKKAVAAGENVGIADDVFRKQIREQVNKNLLEFAETSYYTETTISEQLLGPFRKEIPIDDKVKIRIQEAINRPAFQDLKKDISQSISSQFKRGEAATKFKNSLTVTYDDAIKKLRTEKTSIQTAGEVLDSTQAARIKTIDETISSYQSIIDGLKAKTLTYNDFVNVRKQMLEAIADNRLGEESITTLQTILEQTDDIIARDRFNIIDDLYERRFAEGKTVYVLREGAEKSIDRIVDKVKQLDEILAEEDLAQLLDNGRFILGSGLETKMRKFLDVSNSGKTLEDLFEESQGMWIARNKEEIADLIKLGNPSELMSKVIEGPRFRTQEEIDLLNERWGGEFEFKKEYTDITNYLEEAMQFIDESYGTTLVKGRAKGIVRHAITPEAKEYKKLKKFTDNFFDKVDKESGEYILMGNTKTFAGRKYRMSVAEANRISRFNIQRVIDGAESGLYKLEADDIALLKDRVTQNLFSEYYTDSFADSLLKMNTYGSAIKVMDTALVGGWAADKDVLRFADAAEDVPLGFTKVSTKQLKNKLEAMSKVYEDNEMMKRLINSLIENKKPNAFIDNNVFDMIGRLGDTDSITAFTKVINGTNNMFKRLKIFSLGFHFKNLVGNASNLYLAGVPVLKIPGLLIDGMFSKKGSLKLMDDFVASGLKLDDFIKRLPEKDQLTMRAYNLFANAGFADAGRLLFDLDELLLKQGDEAFTSGEKFRKGVRLLKEKKFASGLLETVDSGLQLNIEINQLVDNGYRLGYIRKLMKEGVSDEDILIKVKTALLDPSAMTAAEKTTIRKYIPFYTFAKKNLAFQVKNVFENPVQYKRFLRGIRSSWNFVNVDWETDLQPYQKENLWLPIPLTQKDGKYYQLKTSFPVSDLGEYLENPAQKIISSLTPLIRAPFEYTINRQIFTGQEIQRFEGEKGRDLGFLGADARTEYLIEQTGLERLIAPVTNIVSLLQNNDAARIAPTVASMGDVETARRSASYDRLDQLRDLFKYYKQEQIPILTLSEIENINKPRATLAQRLQAIQRKRNR